MHRIGDITVEHPVLRSVVIYIKQDDDVIVVYRDGIGDLVDALIGYSPSFVKEPTPAPEKWYVVLKNSNSRLLNHTNDPITFSVYADARIYGGKMGGLERTFVPISVDEYERAFGR